MICPHCRVEMQHIDTPSGPRLHCPSCPRYALPGESAADIERHERERQAALVLLDAALGKRAAQREADRQLLAEMEATIMGQSIATKGCPRCQSTMYKTTETDDQGNPTSETMWICNNCGLVE